MDILWYCTCAEKVTFTCLFLYTNNKGVLINRYTFKYHDFSCKYYRTYHFYNYCGGYCNYKMNLF